MGWYVLNNYLNDGSDNLYERMAALPPGRLPEIERAAPPVPPAPPPPAPTAIIRPDPQILAARIPQAGDRQRPGHHLR